ncbi:hypothetical protein B0G75_103607 [Paraburkholderia sp. BL18I3N2]|uniref:hypothetical protein n=1 Tax=Paraburkholderia sp. BL18I3N2 TaxID=1938799 RepID=UPI000D07908C|nr:hypothetical protein [Paraburkholderia sp. BL18I3N2]PRX33379.1 hypothetical protein B0G75_103607 [Paraburkholderia sp. BL18I3N2]
MTKRYIVEVCFEDEGLLELPVDATYTLRAFTGETDMQVSVFETLDENLAAQWAHILDAEDRAYVARVMDGNKLVSQQCARNPGWRAT